MFERFTAEARHTVAGARREAVALRHGHLGTEHLLLGLLAPGSAGVTTVPPAAGVARRVLLEAGVDGDFVRAEIRRLTGTCDGGLGEDAAEALLAIGIDLDAVRSRVEAAFGEGALDSARGRLPGRLSLTRRAKKVLELSLREAKRLGHNYLATEHILLGILREGGGRAAEILATHVSLSALREQLKVEMDRAA